MPSTCKLKTFHEFKALISFKFAKKDSIKLGEINRKFCKNYLNTTFDFLMNSILEKGKNLAF